MDKVDALVHEIEHHGIEIEEFRGRLRELVDSRPRLHSEDPVFIDPMPLVECPGCRERLALHIGAHHEGLTSLPGAIHSAKVRSLGAHFRERPACSMYPPRIVTAEQASVTPATALRELG